MNRRNFFRKASTLVVAAVVAPVVASEIMEAIPEPTPEQSGVNEDDFINWTKEIFKASPPENPTMLLWVSEDTYQYIKMCENKSFYINGNEEMVVRRLSPETQQVEFQCITNN